MKTRPDLVKNPQIQPATSVLAWDEIRYVYDPLGRRIYDGWNVVEERTERQGAPGISKFLFWGEDLSGSMQGAGGVGGLLTQMEKTDTTNWSASYYHYDGNGNVATVSGPFRAVIAKFSYDGFGRTVTQTGAKSGIDITAIPYRFSTKPMELELATSNTTLVPPPVSSGLYYYGYRFYSPNLGRWISRDPIREEGGLNLYVMVGNDGLNNMDLLGLDIWADFLDITLNTCEFCSGASDNLTFGLTEVIRNEINDAFYGGDYIVQNETAYNAGKYTEAVVEIAVSGGSAALKQAATKKIAKEAAEIIAKKGYKDLSEEGIKKIAQDAKNKIASSYRAAARKKMGNIQGEVIHHANTLNGHFGIKGKGGVSSYFPTLGVSWFANARVNLIFVEKGLQHTRLHQRAYVAEKIAVTLADPSLTAARLLYSFEQEFNGAVDIKMSAECKEK